MRLSTKRKLPSKMRKGGLEKKPEKKPEIKLRIWLRLISGSYTYTACTTATTLRKTMSICGVSHVFLVSQTCHNSYSDMDKPQATCHELTERTANALDNNVLQMLFVSTQRNNLELCIRYALEK